MRCLRLSSTLSIAAFDVGIAAESVAGSLLVGGGLVRPTPLVGAVATLGALLPLRPGRARLYRRNAQ